MNISSQHPNSDKYAVSMNFFTSAAQDNYDFVQKISSSSLYSRDFKNQKRRNIAILKIYKNSTQTTGYSSHSKTPVL
jgi:hypothetical protein